MVNNLFTYATKELSQDAFICWLCSFAINETECKDNALKKCAEALLCEFIGADKGSNIKLIKIRKQVKNIDVLLTVEYLGKTYEIIVEDKVFTSEHDDQLNRYKNVLKKECPEDALKCIYYKTGFQSDYSNVKKAGYKIFDRARILELFKPYRDSTQNTIFLDYYDYWENYETITNSYRETDLEHWDDWRQINGFFDEMQSELTSHDDKHWAGYGWVNNRGGGFWGFWYGINDDVIVTDEEKAALYLQLEISWNDSNNSYDRDICLKYEIRDEKNKRPGDLCYQIINVMAEYGFYKPSRIGSGTHITIGRYQMGNCRDYEGLKDTMRMSLEDLSKLIKHMKSEI